MFEKKIILDGPAESRKAHAADAVSALASALGYSFKERYLWGFGGGYTQLSAVGPVKPTPVEAAAITPGGEEYTRRYSAEDGVRAIAEALGLEFRAEYVVGKAEPQLKAVKKAKVK